MTALQSSSDYVAFAGLRYAYAHLLRHLVVHTHTRTMCRVCLLPN